MKIISKHKDYYDHLVSHYGYDDHIVYDRRNDKPLDYKWIDRFYFYICGVLHPVLRIKEDFVFSADDPRISKGGSGSWDRLWLSKNRDKPSKLNAQMRQPVLCEIDTNRIFIPRLQDFGFASYIPPHEMYEKIYAFLGWLKDNPAPPDNQTDKQKVVSHGFDVKKSFRPQIKSY
jgi:hypothetical protein